MKLCGVLLAAGFARRFGSDKLLAPLPGSAEEAGTPIALSAARHLLAALPDSIAVVRPRARKLAALLRKAGCRIAVCRDAAEGMGTSLAAGVRAAQDADGWIVALADMPFVRPQTIRAVARALEEGAAIAAPAFRGERGHPVGFARRFREELLALRGDQGARKLLAAHPDWITLCDTDDRGVLRDIDRPEDLAAD